METALLFDRRSVDVVPSWQEAVAGLGKSSILWVDMERPDPERVAALADAFQLSDESRKRLTSSQREPYLCDFESYLHVTVVAPAADGPATGMAAIECLVSECWLVTVRENRVEVVEQFRERTADGAGETGNLEGLEFLATLLEWVLNGYLRAFDRIEDALNEFDTRVMEGANANPDDELRRLVELRAQIGKLRRALVSHRELFLGLTRPDLEQIAESSHAGRFDFLRSRLEDAVQAARDCRDSIVGSFDVLIARSEQRTNEIMKVLTLASVLLLPGALIAGVMGMNFRLGLFEHAIGFWIVLAAIAALAGSTLAVARARKWI